MAGSCAQCGSALSPGAVFCAQCGAALAPAATTAQRPVWRPPSFTWRDGTVCTDPQELISLADRHWDEALRYLAQGDWERWFLQLNRHDLVHAAEQARAGQAGHPSAALEDFLRCLDGGLPQPELHVAPPWADLGLYDLNAPPAEDRAAEVQVMSVGRGCVYGTVQPGSPWLKVEPQYVEAVPGRPVTVRVSADRSALRRGRKFVGTFDVQTNGGAMQVTCSVRTPGVWTSSDFWLVLAGFRGGIAGFCWGALLGAPASVVAHWPAFLLIGWLIPGFDAWRAGVSAYLLAWCALAGALAGGFTVAWRTEWTGLLDRNDDPHGVEVRNLWLSGLYGGAASALVIASAYTLMTAGLLVWLAIALTHFAYIGFAVSIPIMLLGAATGVLYAGLIVLVRTLIWLGLRSLLARQ